MKKLDLILLISIIGLVIFGFFMVYDASSFISYRDFGNKYHYVKDQSLWMILGFVGMFALSFFDYHKFYNLALPLLVSAIILLIIVFIPGIGFSVLGAHRWLDFNLFVIQPAEFVKLALAIYLAAWFSKKERGRFLAFLLLIGLVLLLVMAEPDMGTTIIILGEALILFFLSGGNVSYFGFLTPLLFVLGFILIKIAPYRAKRLEAFFNPLDPNSPSSYHVRQILIALGSGGLTGVGVGNSLQIFAVVTWRGISIALSAKDNFGRLLAGGITAFLVMQIVINLGAQTALFPLTGVPLPFISYGGSSLIVDLCSVGILLNISRQSVKS
jgi:cell division protein FtsW